MKFHTFSVVAGTTACNAKCPYCISKVTAEKEFPENSFNYKRLLVASRIAKQCGISTALITGKGEPTLYPDEMGEMLAMLSSYFPIIELQTNGLTLEKLYQEEVLHEWYHLGLTTICLSLVHYDEKRNQSIFLGENAEYPNLLKTVAYLKTIGFSIRWSVVGCLGYIDNISELTKFITMAKKLRIDQFTWRPVKFMSSFFEDRELRARLEIPPRQIDHLINSVKHMPNVTKLVNLPHGAEVYDFDGQNLCLSNCLTTSHDPNDIRQLIYFPNGDICYDWVYPGAKIL